MARRHSLRLRLESLESRHLLAIDGPRITEFVAANSTTLADEDGDFSDWIELHNPGSEPISLGGWKLTDDLEQPARWTLPDMILPAGGYAVVFASGKDRQNANAPLHTNFRLDADGEALVLVRPDGVIEQQFAPSFPPQQDNIPYGLPLDQLSLLTPQTVGRWYVPGPADVGIGHRWISTDFDASTWEPAQGGIGYEQLDGYPNFGFEQGTLADWTSSGEVRANDQRFGVTPTQGEQQALLDAGEFSTARFSLETFLGLGRADLNYTAGVQATVGSGLKRTIDVTAGSQLQFDWNFLTNEPEIGGAQDFGFLSISPGNLVIPLAHVRDATMLSASSYARETGYGTVSFTFPETGRYTVGVGVVNVDNRFRNSALLVDNFLIDGIGSLEETFAGRIDTDVGSALNDISSSLWVRYELDVSAEPLQNGTWQSLALRLSYDDGYAAFWNGLELARSNAEPDASWNSLALSERPDAMGSVPEWVTIPLSRVRPGENTLAIQVFKSADDDPNLFLEPHLTALGAYAETPVYLRSATPGRANVSESFAIAEPVQFSKSHGFYDEPFLLELTTPTAGAAIHYTLDGTAPTSSSPRYEAPLQVTRTETVRAAAFREDLEPSDVVTQSYLFLRDVFTQSRSSALARGFAESWGFLPADYAMDPRIAGQNGSDSFDGRYADTLRDDLLSVPTLSIVMDQKDLFGEQGIYSNPEGRGIDWERPTSVELIHPDGTTGFQVNAGIRLQGGISRFLSSKHSLRLLFKDDYGPAKLEYPFFGPDGANEFDSISLRAGSGEHLVGIHYIRDEFSRRLQMASGNLAARGNYMHLYINGIYWGMYNPAERIDGQYAASYLGGEKEDYDVLNGGDLGNEGVSVVAGSLDAWSQTVALASQVEAARSQAEKTAAYLRLQGLNSDGSRNPDWEVLLDTNNYIDYLITQVYVRNDDWPIRNYYMLRRRGPDSTGFQFFVWDNEFTLDRGTRTSLSSITRDGPGVLYQMLDTSDAFRLEFSDRVQQQFKPGGAFYVNPDQRTYDPERPEDNRPATLYARIAAEVFSPLAPETARWGDEVARNGRLLVRDGEWQQTVNDNLATFFPNRSRDFLATLRRDGFYRDAPAFDPPAGLVDPGRQVVLSADNDTAIYFTLDGSDPRLTDGSISPNAQRYTMPIPIIQRTTVLARGLRSGEWTAIDSNLYVTDALPATPESLRISELNFNPHDALPQFGELNVDNDEFEFIELTNVSSTPVNLGGVSLVRSGGEGVEFTFGSQILSPGAHVVIPQNRAAVVSRYGSAITLAIGQGPEEEAWTFDGRLGNGGETITLVTSTGQLIERVAYRDSSPWPNRADGNASSLERVDLAGDANRPQSWRASDRFGGSPAMATASITSHVVMNEILARPAGGDVDAIELFNASSSLTDVSGWYLSDSDADYFRYRIPPETSLAPNAYRVLDQRAFGFGIDGSTGDTLFLIAADAAGRPTHFVDVVAFDASDSAVSLGRWPNATGRLFPQQQTSLGSVNTGPQLGDVIVSELHFHPDDPDGGGILTSDVLEFIEVTNRSSASVDLSGWSLAGDVQFTFADNVQLAAGATLVITSFDAVTNPARDVTFRLAMDVAATLRTVGPWTGTLEDQGGLVQLFKPAQIDANPMTTGRILVDEVEYKIEAPWPTGIGGTGHSLSRVRVDAFGDSPTSWQAAKASPGRAEFTAGPLGDVNGDGILNGTDADLLCSALRDLDPLSQFDLNADGRVNQDDLDLLIRDLLNSGPGDANLDGVFNSRDLVQIFIAAEYEDAMAGNSTWSEGDWNCDGEFNSRDIVLAFVEGDYSARAVRQSWALLAAAREDERPRRAARVDRAFALESR